MKALYSERSLRQHPSLRAKKYDDARDIWQARINRGEVYELIEMIKHPK